MSYCISLPAMVQEAGHIPVPTATVAPTATAAPTATPTSSYIFNDEFNDTSVDTSKWTVLDREGDTGNNEKECYKPANITEAGGSLTITSRRLAATISCSRLGHGATDYGYTSGYAQWSSFNFLYGTLEFRVKTPSGGGQWPAVWLLGANCQATNVLSADNSGDCAWPVDAQTSAEIDILEQMGSSTNFVMTLHNGPAPLDDSYANGCGMQSLGFDNSAGFHTYQLIWAPNSLIWKIDGVIRCTSTTHVPSHSMFLIINIALGGAGGAIDDSAFPQTMQVDYVRVYAP